MKYILNVLFLASVLSNSSCLAGLSSNYKHSTYFRGGYRESEMGNDVHHVTYRGNMFTKKKKTHRYALIRAAEVTKKKGHSYFTILDKIDETNEDRPCYTLVIKTSKFKSWGGSYLSADEILQSNTDILKQRKK